MTEPTYTPPLLLRIGGILWVGLGILLPLGLFAAAPQAILNDTGLLTLLLGVAALVSSRFEFEFNISKVDVKVVPGDAAIVIALVACTLPQAMLVALAASIPSIAEMRSRRKQSILIGMGLCSTTTAVAHVIVVAIGLSFASPMSVLVTAIAASAIYLTLDAISYVVWEQGESRSGRVVFDYYRRVAPLDVVVTAIAVIIAGPFTANPVTLLVVLGCYQAAVVGLYRLFTSESRHREQSTYLRDVFSRYVPESVADQLADRGVEIRLGGETRDITVLFCDVRGFTSWAERHDAETVISELNIVLGQLTEAVMDHDGTLDKFTGDGLMAFWGAPLDQPDHAEQACRAAVAVHEALVRCNLDRVDAGMEAFRIGVGISTGPAVVGNVGHRKRLDYTAIGDTVNLAARLEAATKDLGVPTAISTGTWEALPAHVRGACPLLGEVSLKGKAKPINAYALPTDAFALQADDPFDLDMPDAA